MKFALENAADVIDEIGPLIQEHYDEIARFKDIPLKPDFSSYKAMDAAGRLRVFTVRTPEHQLIGYGVFFIVPNPHYMSSIQANQDIIFIQKNHRGQGREFIAWCNEQLKSEGVQAVYHHVKAKHNFGPMLERMGFELVDLIYVKRLDEEKV